MALKRYVTEMGMGVDVHGGDYTKAAKRAVSDAIRHSSLNFFDALGKSPHDMIITAKVGAGDPDAIDKSAIAEAFPFGTVTVEPTLGGLDVPGVNNDLMVIVNVVVLVQFEED